MLNCTHTALGFSSSLGEVIAGPVGDCAVCTAVWWFMQVAVGRRSVVKLRVTNTGQRAAFAKISASAGACKSSHACVCVCVCVCACMCEHCVHSTVGRTEPLLPVDKLSISPNEFVLPPQQTKVIKHATQLFSI